MSKVLSRRNFIKLMGNAAIGGGVLCMPAFGKQTGNADGATSKIRNFNSNMAYRRIEKTDIDVSVFSLGDSNEEILNKGLQMGINLIHTSTEYSKGKSIKAVANAIKGRREKVHIALKDNFKTIESALKILGTDYVDFVMFNRHNAEEFRKEIPEIRNKFFEWRDKGLARYAGVTTHKHVGGCIDVAIEAGFFSCVMPSFGPIQFMKLKKQRNALRENKISIIAMKTKGELDSKIYRRHLKVVLSDPAVATIIKGVQSFEDLENWTSAAALAGIGFMFRKTNENYAYLDSYSGCNLCGKCEEACPNDVVTSDVVRCIRYYHDAESSPETAALEFRELGCEQSLLNCKMCGRCEKACPQSISVRKELRRARNLLA
jgi:predicted aldo/keto reductase-like oxidoreductase